MFGWFGWQTDEVQAAGTVPALIRIRGSPLVPCTGLNVLCENICIAYRTSFHVCPSLSSGTSLQRHELTEPFDTPPRSVVA